jgi:DNA-binding NarL/FixJ family response regulator
VPEGDDQNVYILLDDLAHNRRVRRSVEAFLDCNCVCVMASHSVLTAIIGPKGLLRDSLASLLGGHSYQVTGSHHAATDMPSPSEGEGPRLVLLTVARTVEVAVAESAAIRQTCPNCKIVGLLEEIHDEDFQTLAHSPINGCVLLDVSQDVPIRTLDLAMSSAARFVVLADEPRLSSPPSAPD